MKIAISGCGIAGTSTAAFLAQDGHDVTIFEQASEMGPVGAGIMLQPSGQKVLEQLGVLAEVQRQSAPLDGLDAFLKSGRPLIRLRYDSLGDQSRAFGVHRGVLFQQLLNVCQNLDVRVVTSTTISKYESAADHISLVDQGGNSVGQFDFIVAADGSRSKLRTASGIKNHKIEYPYAALWTTGPCSAVTTRLHQVIDGTTRLVGLLPIGNQQCSFFWGIRKDRFDSLIQSGLSAFKDEARQLCPLATELLDSIVSLEQMTFSGYRHVRMRRCHADRIMFVGDAAHPSTPHLGQGVNLALEDAISFAESLRAEGTASEVHDTDEMNIDAKNSGEVFASACRIHHQRRAAKIRYYQQLTRLLSPFFQSDFPLLATGRNIALPLFPRLPWVRTRMLRTLCGTSTGWLR